MSRLKIIEDTIQGWDKNMKIEFCEHLMHNLTVAIRSIWSDDSISDSEKVDRIKWINEFHHRIINFQRDLKHESKQDLNVYEIAKGYVNMNRNIGGELGLAIENSFDRTR